MFVIFPLYLFRFLSMSGDKIMNIFDELKGSNAPTHIIEVSIFMKMNFQKKGPKSLIGFSF